MSRPAVDGIWFEYAQRPGKFSARPVNARGWVALLAVIGFATIVPWGVLWSIGDLSPPLLIGTILLANLSAFLILWRLVLAKGRRLV